MELQHKCTKQFEVNTSSLFTSAIDEMSETDHSSYNVSMDSRDIYYIPEESIEELKLVFSEDEEMLIIRMFNLLGQRWRLIAGRIPGRTAEEIEKYWTSRPSSCEG